MALSAQRRLKGKRREAAMNRMEKFWIRLGMIIACVLGSIVLTMAQDKVVVVPLGSSAKVAELEARVAELERLLAGVSRYQEALIFSGINVHILDGSGNTWGPVNGLGNLIIGYNELRPSGNIRNGSHNLIVGSNHNYTSYGGLVVGQHNTISNQFACVTGGYYNTASGAYSSISGGTTNTASGYLASVSGGNSNEAIGMASSVSGGYDRDAPDSADWAAGSLLEDQ